MNIFTKRPPLITLIIVATACLATPSREHLYSLGKKKGTDLLNIITCEDKGKAQDLLFKYYQNVDPELLELANAMNKEAVGSASYKKKFAELKAFNRGIKAALESSKASQEANSKPQQIKDLFDMEVAAVEIVLESSNHFEVAKKLGEYVSQKAQTKQLNVRELPKLESFKANPHNAFFKKGYELGEKSNKLFTLWAQGKDIPVEKQLEISKLSGKFMQKEVCKLADADKSQKTDIVHNIAQYLAGAEKAAKEYPLEQTLKKYSTKKELAEKIRLSSKLNADMWSSVKNMFIEGDPSLFNGEIGSALKQYGKAGASTV